MIGCVLKVAGEDHSRISIQVCWVSLHVLYYFFHLSVVVLAIYIRKWRSQRTHLKIHVTGCLRKWLLWRHYKVDIKVFSTSANVEAIFSFEIHTNIFELTFHLGVG